MENVREQSGDPQQIGECYEVSAQQQHLWAMQQDCPGSPFISQCCVLIRGLLDSELLAQALRKTIDRHEALRTRIHRLPASRALTQVIEEAGGLHLSESDLRGGSGLDQEVAVDRAFEQMREEPFDPDSGPVMRAHLLRLTATEDALIVAAPALCADGASLDNIIYETMLAYEQVSEDVEAMQYADFAQWQREVMESEEGEVGRSYWRKKAEGGGERLELPLRKKAAGGKGFEVGTIRMRVDEATAAKVKEVAKANETTVEAVVLAVWLVALWRLTGGENVEVRVSCDGRKYAELEGGVGLYEKYLPIRLEVERGKRFRELMVEVSRELEEGRRWQEGYGWEYEQGAGVEDGAYRGVSYQHRMERARERVGAIDYRVMQRYECVERFGLRMRSEARGGCVEMRLDYDKQMFDKEEVERIVECVEALIGSAVREEEEVVERMQMLSERRRQELIYEINETERRYATAGPVQEMIEEQAREREDAIALEYEGEQVSYGEMSRRSEAIGRYLRSRGVRTEERVGVCMERGLEMVIGVIGVMKAGGAYVPLEPAYPAERLAFMIEDSQAKVILTQQRLTKDLPPSSAKIICIDSDWEQIEQEGENDTDVEVSPQNLVYVIYTSGSTGRPKGVAIEHRQLINYSLSIVEKLKPAAGAGYTTLSTLAADLGNTVIFPSLFSGGCLHIIAREKVLDGAALANYFKNNIIDYLKIVPSHLAALYNATVEEKVMPRDTLILGGESSSVKWVRQLQRENPECKIVNHYGPTETTVGALTYEVQANHCAEEWELNIPLGRPLANALVYILDENLEVTPVGVAGEIFIGGEGLARGYLNRADQTAERFIPHPFAPVRGARLYKTGDLARYRPDSNIEFLGRLDHQVKIRGHRIELAEVEAVISEHPLVTACAVLADGSPLRLLAYVEARAALDPSLRDFLATRLPDYMLPSSFVLLDSLPLTANGKVDRAALPGARPGRRAESDYVAARTEAERCLSRIWCEVLGLERVSVEDNFFKLGGDSILSIQIVARARQAGYGLRARDMFERQTIRELAEAATLAEGVKGEQGPVVGEVKMTAIQERFFQRHRVAPSHYTQTVVVKVRGCLRVGALGEAMRLVMRHHDALRMRFIRERGVWVQVNGGEEEVGLEVEEIEVSGLSETEAERAFEEAVRGMERGLDVSSGLMVRVGVVKREEWADERLVIAIHHLVMDGVSWRVLLEDLQRCYGQGARGEAMKLGAKTASYQRWAEEIERYAKGEEVAGEASYWARAVEAEDAGVGDLPMDHDLGESLSETERKEVVRLGRRQTEELLRRVPEVSRVKVEEVLLTGLVLAIGRWSGKRGLVVDVEGHGRQEEVGGLDVSRTVGWFTAIYPVRLRVSEKAEAGEALKEVKSELRKVPRGGIGYGLLRYKGGDEEVKGRLREREDAEVSFNYLGAYEEEMKSGGMRWKVEQGRLSVSGGERREYELSVTGVVKGGEMEFEWSYSGNKHKGETIRGVAERYIEELGEVIRECMREGRGRYTPEDFPEAGLSQEEVDKVMAEYGEAEERRGEDEAEHRSDISAVADAAGDTVSQHI